MVRQEPLNFLKLADNFYGQKNYQNAVKYYQNALKCLKNDDETRQADLYLKLGNLHSDMEEYDTAQDNYTKSSRLYSKIKDHAGKGYCLTGLGIIQSKNENFEEARSYYTKALKSFKKTGDAEREGIILSLSANTFESQGAWEYALETYKRSYQKFEESGSREHGSFSQIKQKIDEERSHASISRKEILTLVVYLLALTVAEVMVAHFNLEIGLTLETVILAALLIHSSLTTSYNFSMLMRSMMALPIIRIIGLSIPLMQIDALYWFPIISIPLFAASFTIMRSQGLSLNDVGFIWGNIPMQIAIAVTGIFLGIIEYFILQPKPLIGTFNLENLLFASIILFISTGLAEEMLFRGIIQKNAINFFGVIYGLLYTALLFTALHIGWNSIEDLIFVFLVAIFYGYAFYKTKSLFGVTLSHGISNTFLFVIIPFYAPIIYSWLPF